MGSQKLQKAKVRVYRTLIGLVLLTGCTTLPTVKHKDYTFPKEKAFVEKVTTPYQVLGTVRAKVNYQTLDPSREEDDLCKNYYNKAVIDLVKMARQKGGDAVL